MTTSRLETFADGVFAIAATLLILNVRVVGTPLGSSLLKAWPSYAAYAVSFLTIGIIWMNHHMVFALIGRVDRTFLVLNVVFLMLVAFIPFPTGLVATHFHHQGLEAAALTYGATLTLTAVFFNALWLYAALGHRLLVAGSDPKAVSGINRSYAVGPPVYLVATLTALHSPTLAVVLYGVIAVFYVIEGSVFGRTGSVTVAEEPGEA